ncbi:potential protein lysine methyltransferase Set5p [[Candida] jaroonii]|uniref:Potential protein lysine methyltransferase Set5p n=1 Tax=[Candida] jaroonii TaxID=467808 RepID=A0ACA9Y863_9ASCO|nr:potential protein lysine methyltransferase Set5p [[Candida] jaroonii]
MTESKIEVISINDTKEESPETVVPHERQVIDEIIKIWKEDPSTETLGMSKLHALVKSNHPNWSLSEKRVKTLLKKFGLSQTTQFNYANEIKSIDNPDLELPDKIKVVMTTKRGKGLFAKTAIKKGELLWEESAKFFVPPLANLKLVKHGKACSNCGKLLNKRGLDCNGCLEMWCSPLCKNKNFPLHCLLKHIRKGNRDLVNAEYYLELEEYVIKENWNALFAITLIYAEILQDKTGQSLQYFKAMARVSQEIRYKALDSSAGSFDSLSGGALFVQEQQENLWKEGFEKFSKVFPSAIKNGDIDYQEFLVMLGSYNINNLDSCIFEIHSHLNHNCNPTVDVTFATNRVEGVRVYALKDLSPNEELTTTYVNPSHTVQQRQRELRCNWGFTCACQKCKDDLKQQSGAKERKKSETMNKSDIRKMLSDDTEEFELSVPENTGERRKSVRFDEKVIAVSE